MLIVRIMDICYHPFYGIKQSSGQATILINADFQDPPELIKKLKKTLGNMEQK